MFSQSNSFLGGAPQPRPGGPQYGQAGPFAQQPQQPPNQFSPQATGYGGGLQPQSTGFPGQNQLNPQLTGYPQQQQQQQQQPFQPQPTGFQQPQPTGFQQPQPTSFQQPQPTGFQQPQPTSFQQPQPTSFQQPQPTGFQQPQPTAQPAPAPKQQPQPTGMTSAQMASSFRSSTETPPPKPPAKDHRIPKQRLSFITADDQAKFEQLFKSAVGGGGALSGEQARDLLMRSKLPGNTLSSIWYGPLGARRSSRQLPLR